MHCLAAEPQETILRVGVWDRGALVAYDTLVLGALRAGYRCVQLRDARHGTRIELCALLVHIDVGDEPSTAATANELRRQLESQQQTIDEQRAALQRLQARLGDGAAGGVAEKEELEEEDEEEDADEGEPRGTACASCSPRPPQSGAARAAGAGDSFHDVKVGLARGVERESSDLASAAPCLEVAGMPLLQVAARLSVDAGLAAAIDAAMAAREKEEGEAAGGALRGTRKRVSFQRC